LSLLHEERAPRGGRDIRAAVSCNKHMETSCTIRPYFAYAAAREKHDEVHAKRRSGNKTGVRTRHDGPDAEEVYERLWAAMMDHSLPPQTRLVEERLCEIFGLGRTARFAPP